MKWQAKPYIENKSFQTALGPKKYFEAQEGIIKIAEGCESLCIKCLKVQVNKHLLSCYT